MVLLPTIRRGEESLWEGGITFLLELNGEYQLVEVSLVTTPLGGCCLRLFSFLKEFLEFCRKIGRCLSIARLSTNFDVLAVRYLL